MKIYTLRQHIAHPFTNDKHQEITKIQKTIAIIAGIAFAPLFLVPGFIAFYGVTYLAKKTFKKEQAEESNFSKISQEVLSQNSGEPVSKRKSQHQLSHSQSSLKEPKPHTEKAKPEVEKYSDQDERMPDMGKTKPELGETNFEEVESEPEVEEPKSHAEEANSEAEESNSDLDESNSEAKKSNSDQDERMPNMGKPKPQVGETNFEEVESEPEVEEPKSHAEPNSDLDEANSEEEKSQSDVEESKPKRDKGKERIGAKGKLSGSFQLNSELGEPLNNVNKVSDPLSQLPLELESYILSHVNSKDKKAYSQTNFIIFKRIEFQKLEKIIDELEANEEFFSDMDALSKASNLNEFQENALHIKKKIINHLIREHKQVHLPLDLWYLVRIERFLEFKKHPTGHALHLVCSFLHSTQLNIHNINKALELVSAMNEKHSKECLLVEIAEAFMIIDESKEALNTATQIENEDLRMVALERIVRQLVKYNNFEQAINVVKMMSSRIAKNKVFGMIAVAMAKQKHSYKEILTIVNQIQNKDLRSKFLADIAIILLLNQNDSKTAFQIVKKLNKTKKQEVLVEIAVAAAKRGDIGEALKIAKKIKLSKAYEESIGKIAGVISTNNSYEDAFQFIENNCLPHQIKRSQMWIAVAEAKKGNFELAIELGNKSLNYCKVIAFDIALEGNLEQLFHFLQGLNRFKRSDAILWLIDRLIKTEWFYPEYKARIFKFLDFLNCSEFLFERIIQKLAYQGEVGKALGLIKQQCGTISYSKKMANQGEIQKAMQILINSLPFRLGYNSNLLNQEANKKAIV